MSSFVTSKGRFFFRAGWADDWTWGSTNKNGAYLAVPVGIISCRYVIDGGVFKFVGLAICKVILEVLIHFGPEEKEGGV